MKTLLFTLILLVATHCFPTFARAETTNPIVWKTTYNQLASSNFSIRIGSQHYYGVTPIRSSSDPGTQYTTLENIWTENGHEMRLFMYFRRVDTNMWEMYDLRSYNAIGRDWIDFNSVDSLGNKITSLVGQRNYADYRSFLPKDKNIDAEIICHDCSITAFSSQLVPLSVYGYGIDFRIGLPQNETITLSTDPMAGYGINAVLVDSNQNTVLNQNDFSYEWSLENNQIATLYAQSIPYPDGKCAYEIIQPCPNMNAQLTGKKAGVTQLILNIRRLSDQVIIASDSLTIRVIDQIPSTVPSISPTPTPISSELVSIKKELDQLQGEVGVIKLDVSAQKEEISVMRQILNKIQIFINKLFKRNL